ncbi:bifunctional adenosylcobinamide kinase/adenosylcobinamide-phosphate guanylyltransferase [Virgibacillus oceani]
MHVVTGGAYNGKAGWVKQCYELSDKYHTWISAYERVPCPDDLSKYNTDLIILEGVEQWIRRKVAEENTAFTRNAGKALIEKWVGWTQQHPGYQLVVIGTDISKGIVPIEQVDRKWRDMTGWFYQDLVENCERFDVIWYGINNQLKGRNLQ